VGNKDRGIGVIFWGYGDCASAPITLGVVAYPHETLPGDVARGRGDQVDTNFTRVPPTKFGRAKNVQNSALFLTTFDFDREYLRNGSTY